MWRGGWCGAWCAQTARACLAEVGDVPCVAVYSFLVESEGEGESEGESQGAGGGKPHYASSVVVSGVPCLTLAHGITDDPVASHPFFGTTKVVEALARCEGWSAGLVRFGVCAGKDGNNAGVLARDEQTGLVVGFAR